ncbi:NAD(P)H-dependent oxidoreductase [uncultured Bdellovibrio sp.]|uniref:NAD(P)H-dependent oxidoreductase n=1 Tax=Bdellovibrio sp. HCB-162 TaxID=3394234 RepID=UPI0025FA7A94|nr:NAD(P)H-dependent oxidoreductase [uncultured Bdellovibrio sp.]
MKKALVLFAHPFSKKSRVNRTIMDSLRGLDNVHVHDLYEEYPYFHIKVDREQELLMEHDLVVWQHPFYWFSMPPLLKLWCDEVLRRDFAYGPDGSRLQGKDFLLSLTTGGLADPGNSQLNIEPFLAPYQQTVKVCGMNWQTPLVMHSTGKATHEEVLMHAEKVRQTLLMYCGCP